MSSTRPSIINFPLNHPWAIVVAVLVLTLTVRLTQLLLQQNLSLSLFTFYVPSDGEAYLRPIISYKVSDSWSATLGANIFTGSGQSNFFSQLKDNSNISTRVRYSY